MQCPILTADLMHNIVYFNLAPGTLVILYISEIFYEYSQNHSHSLMRGPALHGHNWFIVKPRGNEI